MTWTSARQAARARWVWSWGESTRWTSDSGWSPLYTAPCQTVCTPEQTRKVYKHVKQYAVHPRPDSRQQKVVPEGSMHTGLLSIACFVNTYWFPLAYINNLP